MNWGIFWTIIGTGSAMVGLIYSIIRNFRKDLKEEREILKNMILENDRRIFQIALGKDIKSILTEKYK